jgi:hypothetical protein
MRTRGKFDLCRLRIHAYPAFACDQLLRKGLSGLKRRGLYGGCMKKAITICFQSEFFSKKFLALQIPV